MTVVVIVLLAQGCQAAPSPKEGGQCLNVIEVIEREREEVLAIPGVVDLAYGEDEAGPHVLVFVEDEDNVEKAKREISRLSLLVGCRVVVQPELRIGPR
jgi:hypothetical protein